MFAQQLGLDSENEHFDTTLDNLPHCQTENERDGVSIYDNTIYKIIPRQKKNNKPRNNLNDRKQKHKKDKFRDE